MKRLRDDVSDNRVGLANKLYNVNQKQETHTGELHNVCYELRYDIKELQVQVRRHGA